MKRIKSLLYSVNSLGSKLYASSKYSYCFLMAYLSVIHSAYWIASPKYPWIFIGIVFFSLIVSKGFFKPWVYLLSQAIESERGNTRLIITLPFVVLNWIALFACFYMYGCVVDTNGNPIEGAWEHFYFSAVTLTTLGYGNLVPNDFPTQLVATVETIVGFLGFAVLSGVVASVVLKRIESKND